MGRKSRKSKFDYFDAFERQARIACEQADVLMDSVENFTSAGHLADTLERAHKIEHAGDEVNHAILNSVAVDFITPIERSDIIELAQCLDNVTDGIEAVIQRFYMYDVHIMHPDAVEMAKLIRKSVKALDKAMSDFRNFKKSKKFRNLIMEVNECEEQADEVYLESTRRLYTCNNDDAVYVEVWSRILDRMERCCDDCEHAADTMSSIVLKNV